MRDNCGLIRLPLRQSGGGLVWCIADRRRMRLRGGAGLVGTCVVWCDVVAGMVFCCRSARTFGLLPRGGECPRTLDVAAAVGLPARFAG